MRRHSKDVLPGGAGPTTRRELSVLIIAVGQRATVAQAIDTTSSTSVCAATACRGLEGRAECREH